MANGSLNTAFAASKLTPWACKLASAFVERHSNSKFHDTAGSQLFRRLMSTCNSASRSGNGSLEQSSENIVIELPRQDIVLCRL
jgi:hypothetical protein